MNPKLFIYKIFHLSKESVFTYCGIAFPISENGDFITCYHVMNQVMGEGDKMIIIDNETGFNQVIGENIIHDKSSDISILINPLKRDKKEYFPILEPKDLIIGEDVYTFGSYKNFCNQGNLEDGYFKGNIVNMLPNSLAGGKICSTTSFPIIEGLSGSPLLTYHNGVKCVGINLGNNQHRIQQSVVTEYIDDKRQFQETTNRIVEFGIALHPTPIIEILTKNNIIGFKVTSQNLSITGL